MPERPVATETERSTPTVPAPEAETLPVRAPRGTPAKKEFTRDGLTGEQRFYARWLGVPKLFHEEGWPTTKADVATLLGVGCQTLRLWEAEHNFDKKVSKIRTEWVRRMDDTFEEHIAVNMQLPGREGLGDRRLWGEYRRKIVKQQHIQQEVRVQHTVERKSVEEIDAELRDLLTEDAFFEVMDDAEKLLEEYVEQNRAPEVVRFDSDGNEVSVFDGGDEGEGDE